MKETIRNWIKQLCNEEFPADNIVALNFGVFESLDGFTLYLIGACDYDAEDDDWACSVDYEPKRKYLEIKYPKGINRNYNSFLSEVVEILTRLLSNTEMKESKLFYNRIITIGFDDGELLRIM